MVIKKLLMISAGTILSASLVLTTVYAASLVYVKHTSIPKFIFDNVGNTVTDPANAFFNHYIGNPVINGNNLYCPSIVLNGGTWNVYTGGWRDSGQTNDKIYINTTTDSGFVKFKENSPVLQVSGGSQYVHACDPSVVKQNSSLWVMAFTGNGGGYDWIVVTSGTDGAAWAPNTFSNRNYEVRFTNKTTGISCCARPSLNWDAANNRWAMYFDATVDGTPGQYLAYSTETVPRNYSLVGRVGDMYDADIHKSGSKWIAMYRHLSEPLPWNIHWADSTDGINFTEKGVLLQPDALNSYCSEAVDNPGMAFNANGNLIAVLFGGCSTSSLTNHKVGVAYPQCFVNCFSGSVQHNYIEAGSPTQIFAETFQYNTISHVKIYDKPNSLIIDQDINATKGDEYNLIR